MTKPEIYTSTHPFTSGFALPDGSGGFSLCPDLMTEEELIRFLRIPEISNSKDYHNVIENLKNMRNLPRLHLCNRVLYPLRAVQEWIVKESKNVG